MLKYVFSFKLKLMFFHFILINSQLRRFGHLNVTPHGPVASVLYRWRPKGRPTACWRDEEMLWAGHEREREVSTQVNSRNWMDHVSSRKLNFDSLSMYHKWWSFTKYCSANRNYNVKFQGWVTVIFQRWDDFFKNLNKVLGWVVKAWFFKPSVWTVLFTANSIQGPSSSHHLNWDQTSQLSNAGFHFFQSGQREVIPSTNPFEIYFNLSGWGSWGNKV